MCIYIYIHMCVYIYIYIYIYIHIGATFLLVSHNGKRLPLLDGAPRRPPFWPLRRVPSSQSGGRGRGDERVCFRQDSAFRCRYCFDLQGPRTHAGPSLIRKCFSFDRFDNVSVSI